MVEPRVIPRSEHTVSRRDIDADALKVLYRLRQFNHVAYLVGGSVRDLLLGRQPKDFDIGTSAHPYQVKKLFRNCWIIGRRFRLAHVRFGPKVIEVATFRRHAEAGSELTEGGPTEGPQHPSHENTFGTPQEDAYRRDFTINALFYDIDSSSLIDHVGGLDDLRAGVVRSIGDPHVRFLEDPVRMLRAVALAARLDFVIDAEVLEAIGAHRQDITRSAPPRLLEEVYKILRAGSAERTFRMLADAGVLGQISPEIHRSADEPLWRSLAALDAYRRRFERQPDTMTNAVLLGSLLVPLGVAPGPDRFRTLPESGGSDPRTAGPRLGNLPLARGDLERLRQILALQRRLGEAGAHARSRRALIQRQIFRDALTWMDIHGGTPELVRRWQEAALDEATTGDRQPDATNQQPVAFRRRRRRRRRRFRPVER
jgi:poly(A) polymerase